MVQVSHGLYLRSRVRGVLHQLYGSGFVSLQAVISALKCLYWLVKEEVAHHTKHLAPFWSLLSQ